MPKCEVGCRCNRHAGMSEETKEKVRAANRRRTIRVGAVCSQDGCESPVCAKGVCRAHYAKERRNAVPRGLPFTVYQWEWDDRRIKSILQSQVDKSGHQRVGARECSVATISYGEASMFLHNNHLQDSCMSSVRLGLVNEDGLVALMTFGTPREQKKNDPVQWELMRFCVKKGYLVPGGASRLFKKFIELHNPTSIVSYSDIAKTSGDMYPMLGFEFVNQSAPGYVWWDGKNVKKRYECMAYKLKAQNRDILGVDDMSESQIMQILGYQKIKNMGNKVWVWRTTD